MGSIGANKTSTLPVYSNERGVILDTTVQADPRYKEYEVNPVEGIVGYKAVDILRSLMRLEEKGLTEGAVSVYDYEAGFAKMPYGKFLTAYSNALKRFGYKVTERENIDRKSSGGYDVFGRYHNVKTTKGRRLHFKKI